MQVCSTPEKVISALAVCDASLVAVDGFQGSGKSTLAQAIGRALKLSVFNVDAYLDRNKGSFFDYLDLMRLEADVTTAGPCVVEGLCCLKVVHAIGRSADRLVYVKRMAIWGWADEDELVPYLANGLAPLEQPVEPLAKSLQSLWDEAAHYHTHFQPHLVANIIYERSAA